MSDVPRGGLLELAAALVAIPSVSHHEEAMADAVEAALRLCPWLTVERVGDNVVARTELGRTTRVVLAGHLDTVPPSAADEPRIVGSVLYGVGSVDMKGGLAVLLHLAGSLPEPATDLTWCFYSGEEVERRFNGLGHLFEHRPELLAGDVAILAEPTGGVVEAGCQGTLRVRMVLEGTRAHTARPFTGRNAIHRLAPVLEKVAAYRGRRPVLDGCEFAEQLQAVGVEGGVAPNVVPDSANLLVNHRFAPDRTAREAEAALEELLAGDLETGDRWEVVDESAGAPPSLDHPVLAALVDATGAAPSAKVGWTDVATFWSHGIPAANFGPGDPLAAHAPAEHVSADELDQAAAVLERVLRGGEVR
ncbi:MAG: succinyl-diaminopimelate desuccinylase [Acidimicrobiales bacterium]